MKLNLVRESPLKLVGRV